VGKSITINVIGSTEPEKISETESRCYQCHAMNKLEMKQKKIKMERKGYKITNWVAQTKQGCKMIGSYDTWEEIKDNQINHVPTVKCPICNGQGVKVLIPGDVPLVNFCVICNGSGVTRKGYWNKWQQWQLDNIKKEFE